MGEKIETLFESFGYTLEKGNHTKYKCYRKDGMFGVICSDTIEGILYGVQKHFERY